MMVKELLEALKNADETTDEGTFTRLLNASIEYCGLTDEEIGELLVCSLPSVQHFKEGWNVPYRAMRPIVYKYLVDKVAEKLCEE